MTGRPSCLSLAALTFLLLGFDWLGKLLYSILFMFLKMGFRIWNVKRFVIINSVIIMFFDKLKRAQKKPLLK